MKPFALTAGLTVVLTFAATARSDQSLVRTHCEKCHGERDPQGDFRAELLTPAPSAANIAMWETSLDYVKAGEMPPAKESRLADADRKRLIRFLRESISAYHRSTHQSYRIAPRRLNNREFENSIRDALRIEDIGTHQPTANLIGDALKNGFDTHGDTLGFSSFHLEQHIEAIRAIVEATVLTDKQPPSKRYEIRATEIFSAHTSQNTKRPERRGRREGFDFLDPRQLAYFEPFKTVPETGWYRITIRCTGKDRGRYEADKTGIYADDPIRLAVRMGDRERVFELPDERETEIELTEWMAAGSSLRLHYPTDGLRLRGNGNFKFQNAIAGEYLKQHDPTLYQSVVDNRKATRAGVLRPPEAWHHWVSHWMGPRPRVFGAVVEGPFYETWPPQRQIALLGRQPQIEQAESILRPIAERAWRRELRPGELDGVVRLVQSKRHRGDTEALKEGLIAVFASPAFLLVNQAELSAQERFASKFSRFLESTIPDRRLRRLVKDGQLSDFDGVLTEVGHRFEESKADPFLRAFPIGWLKLHDINFMAPDPDRFRHYHRKQVSEDMTNEALHFFRYAIDNNRPITEFLSADYSFINADLATVYALGNVPQDSTFRKFTFADRRRGGLLGMGAFLTVTADSLGTSPIHRAIYVMENLLGIHPSPPPPNVKIEEPDVRSARTIKEVLEAHRSDKTCAACHQTIDPFGYAFENFDPTGAWRDTYDLADDDETARKRGKATPTIPIDASASFLSGAEYHDIRGFRELMQTDANQERFVRCFISKLLTYANGEEPKDSAAIDAIVKASAEHDYRILETIAAVIDSPLFREE